MSKVKTPMASWYSTDMKEGFNFKNVILGERHERITPARMSKGELTTLAKNLERESDAAYQATNFIERDRLATQAVKREAFASLRHFAVSVKGHIASQDAAFWRKAETIQSDAITAAGNRFAHADESEAAYKAAYDEPGPSIDNVVYLAKSKALIDGIDSSLLVTDATARERYITEARASLEKIGIRTLCNFVSTELRALGVWNAPGHTAYERLSDEKIYERLTNLIPDTDYAKKAIIREKKLRTELHTQKEYDPAEELFLRFALTGLHGTWEVAQPHRAAKEGKPNRVHPKMREENNYRPLPDYLRVKFEELSRDSRIKRMGASAEDYVLHIAYELYKDIYIARQENRDVSKRNFSPDASVFAETSTLGANPPEQRTGLVYAPRAAAAAAVAAGLVASGEVPREVSAPMQEPTRQEQTVVTPDTVSSPLAKLSEGNGAIELLHGLIKNLERAPAHRAAFMAQFGLSDGESPWHQAEMVSTKVGLFVRETGYSETIYPGDRIEVDTEGHLALVHVSGDRVVLEKHN